MAIKVNVRLVGAFRGVAGKSVIPLNLKKPTVKSVVLKLAESLSVEAKRMLVDLVLCDQRSSALILVNGKEIGILKGLETGLKDGDDVALIPVSHGG